ncbi:hypothetical protein BH23BAC4_BH23BAC4_06680 [soil metagenome]
MTFRILAVAIAFAMAAPASQAQLIPKFGVSGGLNFASLGDAASADLSASTGFHLGLYAEMGLGPVSLRPGLFFIRAGDIEVPTLTGTEERNINFVTVPIDFKFSAGLPIVSPYVLVGPEVRFPLGDFTTEEGTRQVNVALNAGAGLAFRTPIVGPQGFIEVRYAGDITGLVDEQRFGPIQANETFKLNLFMVRAGVGL